MTAQVANNQSTNIGRMFARQNVPMVYAPHKNAAPAKTEDGSASIDTVSLSPYAPRPLTADFLEDALNTGAELGDTGKAEKEARERMREDRIYAAMCALSLIGHSGEPGSPLVWPGGIPVPTREEMEIARRRLAQRPSGMDASENPDQLQRERLELLQKLRDHDFSATAFAKA